MCADAGVQSSLPRLPSVHLPVLTRLSGREKQRGCISPEEFQLVEAPGLGVEHVHHEVHEVQEDPTGTFQPLHVEGSDPRRRQAFQDVLGDGPHLNVRVPGGKDEEVRGSGDAPEVQSQDIFGFSIQSQLCSPGYLRRDLVRDDVQASSRSTVTSISTSTSE